jgi:hypothetical protein
MRRYAGRRPGALIPAPAPLHAQPLGSPRTEVARRSDGPVTDRARPPPSQRRALLLWVEPPLHNCHGQTDTNRSRPFRCLARRSPALGTPIVQSGSWTSVARLTAQPRCSSFIQVAVASRLRRVRAGGDTHNGRRASDRPDRRARGGTVWGRSWGGLRGVDMIAGEILSFDEHGDVPRRNVGSAIAAVDRPLRGGGAVIGIERLRARGTRQEHQPPSRGLVGSRSAHERGPLRSRRTLLLGLSFRPAARTADPVAGRAAAGAGR